MEPRTLQYFADAAAGELTPPAGDIVVPGLSTDSRALKPGELFVAVTGENFDGHDFVAGAAAKGACGVVMEKARGAGTFQGCPVIAVRNSREALGLIASRYRGEFDPLMVAVGGSNGKTTTKEILASIFRTRWPVVWSPASFNNEIGVPLSLLRIGREHRAAVLEAGTNHPGELAPLLGMIRPRFGIVTSIGREHLEFFGDLQGVICEEGAMAEAVPADGVLVLNGDSPGWEEIAGRSRARVVRAGFGAGNDWRAEAWRVEERGVWFRAAAPSSEWSGEYHVPLLGRHQVVNALLALAVAAESGFTREETAAGLAACPPPKMRLRLQWTGGVGWVNDAYNSNPESLTAALETLAALPCAGRRFAVLGDMLELGGASRAAHLEAGRAVAAAGIEGLWAVGQWAGVTAEGARSGGLGAVVAIPDSRTAAEILTRALSPGDIVLLKGSRGARLESVEELWIQSRAETGAHS